MSRPPQGAADSASSHATWLAGSGHYSLADVADLTHLEQLCGSFARARGVAVELVDEDDGALLVSTGFCRACEGFHRANPALCERCEESRRQLRAQLDEGNGPVTVECANGLLEGAVTIAINGHPLGRLFCGQVLAAPPSRQRFAAQASDAGLDVDAYLEAIDTVGIVTADELRASLQHLAELCASLIGLGLRCRQQQLSEDRFRLLAENVPGAIYLCRNDERYTMLYLNDEVEQLTGYSKEDFLADRVSFVELYHPEDAEMVYREVDQALAERRRFHLVYRIKHRSGEWRWIDEQGRGIFANDELLMLEGYLQDVTEVSQAQETLARERHLLNTLMDTVPDTVYFKDRDSRFIRVNQAQARVLGLASAEDAVGHSDQEYFTAEHAASALADEQRIIESGMVIADKLEHVRRADGQWRWLSTTKVPLYGSDGEAVGTCGISRDISERFEAEQSMRESEQKFRMLAEQSMMGVAIIQESQVKYANQAMAELYGFELEELLAMSADELLRSTHPDDTAILAEAVAIISQGESDAVERLSYRMAGKHGEERWAESYLRNVMLGGRPALMLTTIETTERVLAEQKTKAQRDMGMALSSARNLDDALACCLDAALRIGELDAGRFFLLDDATGALVECCRRGTAAVPEGLKSSFDTDSDFARLAASGKPLYSDTESLAATLGYAPGRAEARALAVIPIVHDDRAIGCACLFSAEAREVLRSARIGLQAVGQIVGGAIARVRAEEALRASEERHRRLMDESPVPWVVVREGFLVYANRALSKLVGYEDAEQAIGAPMLEHIHPDDHALVTDRHRRRLAGEDLPSPYDIRIMRQDGALLWVELHAERCEFKGQPAIQVALVDITQPKRLERLRRIQRELGVALGGGLTLPHAVELVLRAAAEAVETGSGALYLANELDGALQLATQLTGGGGYPPTLSVAHSDPAVSRGVAGGDLVYVRSAELQASGRDGGESDAAGLVAVVPVTHAGSVIACLLVETGGASELPAEVQAALENIAGQAGSAITRLRAEAALRNSEERYRRLMNDSPVPLVVIQDGKYVFANPAYVDLLKLDSVDDVVGQPLPVRIHPDDQRRVLAVYEDRMAGGDAPQQYVIRMLRPEGEVVWVEVHAQFREFAGRPATLAALVDITERQQAERALRESQQMLRLVVDNVPQFIFWKDVDSVYTGCNRNFARAAGVRSPAEIVGKTDYDLPWEADQAEMFRQWDRRVMEAGSPEYHIIEPQLQADGKHAWLDTSKIPLRDADGKVVGILGSYEDITERKQAEWQMQQMNERLNAANEELRAANEELNAANEELARSQAELLASEERFRTLAEAPHTGILFLEDGRIADVNRGAEEMFGYTREEVLGRPALEFVAEEAQELVSSRMDDPSGSPYEAACQCKDGSEIIVEIRARPLSVDGRAVRVVSLHDVTQRKRTEVVRQVLLQIAEATSATENLEALLKNMRGELGRLLDTRNMFVALYDESSGLYSFPYAEDEQDANFAAQQLTGSLTDHVRSAGSALLWNAGDPRPDGVDERRPHGPATQSWLGVPLRTVRGVIGVLAVQSYDSSLTYTEQDEQMLTLVSGSIAMAIERKRTLEAMRTSEERYRAFVEQSSEAIWCVELDVPLPISGPLDQQLDHVYEHAYIAECNDAMARMYGFDSADELVGTRLGELLVRSDPANVEYLQSILQSGFRITDAESHERDRHGADKIYLNNVVGVVEDGYVVRAWGTQRDITKRRRAEEALLHSEQQYRTTLDSMGDAIHVIDRDFRVLLHNNALAQWHRMFGLASEIEGQSIKELYAHLSDQVWEEYRRVMDSGQVVVTEELSRLAGRTVATESRKIPVVEDGKVVRVITILRDISKRKQAEAALRGSEERHRRFVEGTIDLVLQLDGEGCLTYVNPTAAQMLEIDPRECLGRSIWDFVHPDERQRSVLAISRMIHQRQPSASYESRIVSTGGQIVDVLWTVDMEYAADGELSGINAILHDITEHKRLTQQLIREQKEESMLTLAGGIAHDFNNILMGVLGSATLLRDSQVFDSEGKDLCSAIVTSSERMVDLTSKLLAYARGGRRQPQPVDVNDAINDTLSMLRGSIPGSVDVVLKLCEDLWPVEADPGQLHQVFLNLILNAAEAMRGGGQITVATGNTRRERDWTCSAHQRHVAGEYAFIEVADNGHGMDLNTLARIFEPFFSTKFQGRGLGLAAAKGIVVAHGGCIHAHSQPGRGSRFHVYLPRTDKSLQQLAVEPFVSVPCDETVLIIDDEEIVRRTAQRMLERQGFTVFDASSGAEGLELFRQHRAEIDLVMFDMSMPQMSGAEFYSCLRQLDREVKTIAVSGYSEAVALSEIDRGGLGAFVQKPFAFKTLVSKLREVLDG